jgi:hypothetical protein
MHMADQPGPGEGPKIIIDSDWKSQAQAEKERLAAAEKAKAPTATPGAGGGEHPDEQGPPKADFEELIRMLATQALLYLGAFPDPETGRRMVSLEMAQFNIDLMAMLEAKTKGNLSQQESTILTRMLYELRMQFVEISKAVARAVEQGRVSPQGGVAGPGGGGMPNISIQPPPGT